jgi:hypothetical protein
MGERAIAGCSHQHLLWRLGFDTRVNATHKGLALPSEDKIPDWEN